MATPRVLILRAPGTNCDQETAHAFELAGARCQLVHLNQWLEDPALAAEYQVLCLPGGFSFGDDVAAGQVLALKLRSHLRETVAQFVDADKLVLGICNGLQVLIKSAILLPDEPTGPPATLTWNDSGQFEDRWVRLQTDGSRCVFLRDIAAMYLPVAHAEGKFVARSSETLQRLAANGQLALRYAASAGAGSADAGGQVGFPDNPNGSEANVAGVCDATGRVFGLMPHPERFVDRTQHPRWTRETLPEEGDGLALFRNAVAYFKTD